MPTDHASGTTASESGSRPTPPPFPPTSATAASGAALPKTYRPEDHEGRIRARWDAARAFHAEPGPVERGERRPYSIVIPPPNVTAALHLGHALNNTLQDILARAHRMMGFETLWMPGTDHAGIATQTVVERRVLKEEGKRRTEFAREEFVGKIQAFKDEYERTITDQLKVMGCSCDWDRQRFTMDEQCAAAVREAFFRLFRDGLIYRGKRLVNWDPVTQTALADDEVEMEDVEGFFYYLRYPLGEALGTGHQASAEGEGKGWRGVTWGELARRGYPGAGEHADGEAAWVTVATTRPETYLGDTAVAMNPKDPRAAALRGLSVRLPLVGRVIPIVEDDYVVLPAAMQADPEEAAKDPKAAFATGFLKVTPAHDPNDYEIGRRHGLAQINVMAPDASISDKHGWEDVGEAGVFVGMTREAARKSVVGAFRDAGLLEAQKPYRHSVGHSYRSHAAIEPYLSDQWYVKVTDDRLAGAANRALAGGRGEATERRGDGATKGGDGELRFTPARYAKTYEGWHDNIRDWCISRQLWWGHRIPVWSHPSLDASRFAEIGAISDDPDIAGFERYSDWNVQRVFNKSDGEVLGVHLPTDAFSVCVRPGRPDLERQLVAAGFTQDPDVLDTWFSSALWPLSTMGWPDGSKFPECAGLLDAFNPTNVLCTAREIITLWVSRMVMFNRYFLGQDDGVGEGNGRLPFRDVFIHAMIMDGEGRKMSKSLGNGVDPRDIIASHGADAMRFTLCQMTTQTQDVRMPVVRDEATGTNTSPKFDLGRNFCNKLWNAARFAASMLSDETGGDGAAAATVRPASLVDRWMVSRLADGVGAMERALGEYQFSEYATAGYDLLWRDFCDWYLEAIKPTAAADATQRAVLAHTLESIVRALHPVMPFVTEAIYESLGGVRTAPVAGFELSPSRQGGLLCTAGWPRIDASLRDEGAERAFERVRALVTAVREVRALQNVQPKRKVTLHIPAGLAASIGEEGMALVATLAGLGRAVGDGAAGPSAKFVFEGVELALSDMADALDAGAERERLSKKIADLEKSMGAISKRLDNPGYVQKAPPKLVAESKAQLDGLRAEWEAAKAALEGLGGA